MRINFVKNIYFCVTKVRYSLVARPNSVDHVVLLLSEHGTFSFWLALFLLEGPSLILKQDETSDSLM